MATQVELSCTNIDGVEEQGQTALIIAAAHGHLESSAGGFGQRCKDRGSFGSCAPSGSKMMEAVERSSVQTPSAPPRFFIHKCTVVAYFGITLTLP